MSLRISYANDRQIIPRVFTKRLILLVDTPLSKTVYSPPQFKPREDTTLDKIAWTGLALPLVLSSIGLAQIDAANRFVDQYIAY